MSSMTYVTIHWFRQDLRLQDNPSLTEAAQEGQILPIYILDDVQENPHAMGSASRLWLHHSLKALDQSLGNTLSIYKGNPLEIFKDLQERHTIQSVHWNRCYEPWCIERDTKIKDFLKSQNIDVMSHNGSLLWEPWEVLKKDKTPYKVFTPFYRNGCLSAESPRKPLDAPIIKTLKDSRSLTLRDLELLPDQDWGGNLMTHWNPGESGAQACLDSFIDERLHHYKRGRDYPADSCTSRLSPHLHFGEISPNQAWYGAQMQEPDHNLDHFLSELGWREFAHSLLYHFPTFPEKNFQKKFDGFPWEENDRFLKCWQQGQTGYPIVDAGMRELWQTGYMHNRVRMIVGSFLVKNLLLHWHHGAPWFWDCLLDADLANNSAGWQWIAGSGADAAPYFRIFNPITQGQKFDPEGAYTKRFVPELKSMPLKYLFNPFDAPESVLQDAGVDIGNTYPAPIVDIKASREKALMAFKQC